MESAHKGKDLFVATGTGSGKTECFLWPMMAKLAEEAKSDPDSWDQRGIRTIILYPMNALVSDQLSRLRRLMGDPDDRFLNIFQKTCGDNIRRPQFGMYTGRTPYPGKRIVKRNDLALAETYSQVWESSRDEDAAYLEKLVKEGKLPAKKDMRAFIERIKVSDHNPDPEDAELLTRFEMQKKCPDILITNYSMLEYMMIRPQEATIWENTKAWLNKSKKNRLLFVIDEAHMYKGSSGGEIAYLIRRLFNRLGISRDKVQFILTTASMPDQNEIDRQYVLDFADNLTSATHKRQFCYLTGEREKLNVKGLHDIPDSKFLEINPSEFEGNDQQVLKSMNQFWKNLPGFRPFSSMNDVRTWLYDNLTEYSQFIKLFQKCRGNAVSMRELASDLFPNMNEIDGLNSVSILLAIAPMARNNMGNVLFPARMHTLFRGLKGVYACLNPECDHVHHKKGMILGDVFVTDEKETCKCGGMIYELINDRRCGSLFVKGYVLVNDFRAKKQTYLWTAPGAAKDEVCEIHLYIPEEGFEPQKNGKYQLEPCYLDVYSGYLNFKDDSLDGKPGIRTLYYTEYMTDGRPGLITHPVCPHCQRELGKMQLSSFKTKGNPAFFNLIKTQFIMEPPVQEKMGNKQLYPNEGRKVLLFSDSRQRAAKLARDMSNASDSLAAQQLALLAIQHLNKFEDQNLNNLYNYFALEAVNKNVQLFSGSGTVNQQKLLHDHGIRIKQELDRFKRSKRKSKPKINQFDMTDSPVKMQEQLLRFYCDSNNTLIDSAMSWIEPTNDSIYDVIDDLEAVGIQTNEEEVLEVFNAWILDISSSSMAIGNSISDAVRRKIRKCFSGYGLDNDSIISKKVRDGMGWTKDSPEFLRWSTVLSQVFLEPNNKNGKLYVDLKRIRPAADIDHTWYRCEKCAEITPFLLKEKCPNCHSQNISPMNRADLEALDFWRKPLIEALQGRPIQVIDTEEHTAQVSHKDQTEALWSKAEEYELRFQDYLKEGEAPVDILSSTTTMEVGIDIGSLVAVGLRNIPPMRENYQQRAGRAGRRGSSLSTIVTFCEDGPHDSFYFLNPVPMLRGEPRKPWIDIQSSKIIKRHLSIVIIQRYLEKMGMSLDGISTQTFVEDLLDDFNDYLDQSNIFKERILVDYLSDSLEEEIRKGLKEDLGHIKEQNKRHPDLYFTTNQYGKTSRKLLLDSLYEEGIIPTYSFPKNVVSTYIFEGSKGIKQEVQRGLDLAISEYAPGRSIVVDKTTYQIGGLYYPGKGKGSSNTKSFMEDPSYQKGIHYCSKCGWFGLANDGYKKCPFCGEPRLIERRPMLKPWGFSPKNGKSIEMAELEEKYTSAGNPLYSTIAEEKDVQPISGYNKIKMAVRSNQRIIVVNRGPYEKGFTICCECGAIVPGNDAKELKKVNQPYPLSGFQKCYHSNTTEVDLGYDFITDMLVLEIELDPKVINTSHGGNMWLDRAGQSLSEALRLAVCQELDIEFTELVTGFRIRKVDENVFVDVYLYDSLSSGAGYAIRLRDSIYQLLDRTKQLLQNCDCQTSCRNCLRHYRNQNVHSLLDRKAALELLHWGKTSEPAVDYSIEKQMELLKPLKNILNEEGIVLQTSIEKVFASREEKKTEILVYPSMLNLVDSQKILLSDLDLKYSKPLALKKIKCGFE